MSNITLDEMGPLLSREASARRGTLLAIFTLVALAFLVLAFFWQKKFTSTVQLYVDDSNIVSPLVGAETTNNRDQANVAKEELFSNEIMDVILNRVKFSDTPLSPIERERLKEEVINNTKVYNINNQLLEISFWNANPKLAFDTTSLYAELFLQKTMQSSTEETTEAFEFIIDQVETYRNKLEDAEGRLESFRSRYPGITTSTEGNVDQRIVELRRDREKTSLQFAEADQRRRSLERELSSESSTIAQDYENSQMRDRIAQLQSEINVLRLNYTDDYPDIVRLNQQIEDLKQIAIAQNDRTRNAGSGQTVFNLGGGTYSGSANLSPVYQQLRSDMARNAAEADSLRSRLAQLDVLLEKEVERSTQSSRVERELTELTRDYQINKDLYEDLLRRQESARLSMTLGAEKQGVLYRIAEPANFPILPTGLRFIHIALAGIALATLLPFIYLFVFLKLDPRIRTGSAVTDVLELPLLTVVPHMKQPGEQQHLFSRPMAIVGTIAAICVLYVLVFIVKYNLEAAAGGSLL